MNTYPMIGESPSTPSLRSRSLALAAGLLAFTLNAAAIYGIVASGTQGQRFIATQMAPTTKIAVVNLGELPTVRVYAKARRA